MLKLLIVNLEINKHKNLYLITMFNVYYEL